MSHFDADISACLKKMGVLEARIPPVVLSAKLRLMFLMGALFAALVPLMYVALIPLAWALYWLRSEATSKVHSSMVLASVLLVGSLLILSLLKPLVTRPAPAPEPHYLNPEKQSLLFAFVRSLASTIRVAAPEHIAVDCNVNCYCMFAGGIAGLFRSGFVLTLGLPLVASLRLDQLAGVLAHELGHALLVTTMRSNRVIWTVHAWLFRVASQQDEFDLMLQERIDMAGNAMRPALRLAQLLSKPGRGIIWLLAIAEGVVSSNLRRRIEIGADRYQVRVSGTDGFVSAVLEINLLAVAAQRAIVELSRMKRTGRLVDDYPGLTASLRARYPRDFVQRLLAGLEEGKTGMFSAHPCDKDRIALARTEDCQGIVTADLPAAVLFADYHALCREVTLEFYKQELDLTPECCELVPIESILSGRKDDLR